MKKMNMVEKYECVKALLMGETPTINGEPVQFSVEDAIEFLDGRKEQTVKKNASSATAERKPTKTQLENAEIKKQIAEYLGSVGSAVSITDICKAVGIDSNQKISALVTQMRNAGKVKRIENKGKPYFHLA